ncbi:MAG: hypothetical protein M0Q38_16055 [Bacteroidales bacterium]|nr:hypothetical protein [Bacteroidales bacterium]
MNKITYTFCISYALLTIGLIIRPIVTQAHGIVPADSVMVTVAQCGDESVAAKIEETGSGNVKKQTGHSAEKMIPTRVVVSGEKKTFDASGTVAVGGEGKNFTVQEGGKAILTSGQSVRLLPGTMIEPGGRLVVKVTSTRKWTGSHAKSVPDKPADQITQTSKKSIELVLGYHVYPMPESENISLAITGTSGVLPARVQVSNGFEHSFILNKLSFQSLYEPSLSMLNPVKNLAGARWGERPETIKVFRT